MAEEISIIRKTASAPSPTLRDLVAVVFRQRRLMLISFAAILLAVLLYGLLAPSYQAQMRVLVRRGRIDPVATPTPTEAPLFQREDVTEEELKKIDSRKKVSRKTVAKRPAVANASSGKKTSARSAVKMTDERVKIA